MEDSKSGWIIKIYRNQIDVSDKAFASVWDGENTDSSPSS